MAAGRIGIGAFTPLLVTGRTAPSKAQPALLSLCSGPGRVVHFDPMREGEVAHRTMRALERGDDEILVAKWESLAIYLNRLAPSLVRRAIARINMR